MLLSDEQAAGPLADKVDGLFSGKPKAKPSSAPTPSKAKPSKGLFSDEEDDLFGTPAKPAVNETKPTPVQTRQPDNDAHDEEEKPKAKKPPAGAVSMFGGVDLFGGKGLSPPSAVPNPKAAKKSADPLGGGDLFGGEEEEEDLFAAKPKTKAPPVVSEVEL